MRGKLLRVLLLAALVLLLVPAIAGAATYADGGSGRQKIDNKPDPLTTARGVLKQRALQAKLAGKSAGKVKQVGKGQYVELAREGEGMVWTVLGEFADLKHNEIPEPNREVDNSTIWVPDFSATTTTSCSTTRPPAPTPWRTATSRTRRTATPSR